MFALTCTLVARPILAAPPSSPSADEGGDDALLPPPPDSGGESEDGGPDEAGGLPSLDDEGLDPATTAELREIEFAGHLDRAARAERDERYGEAIREYQAALRIHENDPGVLRGLAHARHRVTKPGVCPRRAIENLLLIEVEDPRNLWLTERGVVLEWMNGCGELYATERLQLAEDLAALPPGAPGRPANVRVIAASVLLARAQRAKRAEQVDTLRSRAREHLGEYLTECAAAGTSPSADSLVLLGDVAREVGDLDDALWAYRQFTELHPNDPRREQADAWIQELEIQELVQKLEASQGGRPTAGAEAAYDRGLSALREGRLVEATAELRLAVAESPWFPQAHYQLGQVLARQGELKEAISSFQKAAAMEPMDHEAHMALGLLYLKEYRGVEDARARDNLGKALRLRPDLYTLHVHLGELWARVDREVAKEHFEAFIAAAPEDDPQLAIAEDALKALEREAVEEAPIVVPAPPLEELRRLDPELQRLINEAYVVGIEQGDWNRAERTLLGARDQFPGEVALLNELAKVVYAQARLGDARTYWEESLAINDAQLEVHERLGLLIDDPREALSHLERAAELGSNTARFELARRLWGAWALRRASEELDRYLLASGPYDLSWERAVALRREMDAVFLRIYGVGLLALIVLLSVPAFRVYRYLRGASLATLLQRSPRSYPEVTRVLSLIRHEILKHNTAFLTDVGHALEVESPDADARAGLLARRLFGAPSDRSLGDRGGSRAGDFERRGIYGRFLGYCEELERVARAHGFNLNLHRKDPIFRPMLEAFEAVARRQRWLATPQALSPTRRIELSRILRRSGHALGRKAFEQISELIRELCIVEVDPDLVADVFRRVCTEQQFAGLEIAPLEIEGDGRAIRMFRTDLEDALVNVLRNSLASAALYARTPIELGIALSEEVDDITGHTTLAIRVRDRSPEQLTNEMLRGRYVERGMGITADLLSRYDGSIAVEPEPGWHKAVVLRFFAVEPNHEVQA